MATSNVGSLGSLNIFDYQVNILQELGHGGFGTVFKGFDPIGSPVAVRK